MKRLIKVIFLTIFLIFISNKEVYANVYFYDYFDQADFPKWEISGNSGWSISNGKFGIELNQGVSNAIPKDQYWNSLWTNYIYKVDLQGVIGTDKNIIINYIDNNNFYEIHAHEGHIHFDKYVNGVPYFLTSAYSYSLINDEIYHFKFIKENNNIKIFLDNIQIFNINDSAPFLDGKVGLRVGTGGFPSSEVWFDNVMVCSLDDACEPSSLTPTPTVEPITTTPTPISPTPTPTPTPLPTPTPTPLTPVVFLPGLGGSINFKEMFLGIPDPGNWQMTPGAKVYDNLLKAFEGDSSFYTFNYDWRKPVLENAQKLNTFIKNTVNPWNNKVDLIGHSLGGLIARACVQNTENDCYAEKLITVGSPHLGAVDIYPVIEAGEIWGKGVFRLGQKY